ncbi:MAG: PaaI family thioesterase [Synergistaceae bacterium]|nr:PaaI family thioesterase [Synergistaceae bacterium]
METMKRLPGSPGCFVCDNDGSNPRSMRLVLMWDAEKKEVHIPFCPDETWCGYSGVVHGGILASVFDDAMAWAVHQNIGSWSVTADFHIRYRKPILVGRKYTAEGRVDETRGRKTRTKARIVDATGDIFAEADALFVSESRARSLSS